MTPPPRQPAGRPPGHAPGPLPHRGPGAAPPALAVAAPQLIRIVEGDVAVSERADAVIATVVGSCVAACLWDPGRGAGGMNHFLLPGTPDAQRPDAQRPGPRADGSVDGGAARRYGVHLMELLINRLMALGARRDRLQAKVFGGAALARGLTDAGERNGAFVRDFLAREGIALVGGSLGGASGRRVEFWPATGRARQKLTGIADVAPPRAPLPPVAAGEPEFF